MLLKIKDFETAVKSAVYVAGNFPRGEDRIAAYRVALSTAERWTSFLKKQKEKNTLEKAMTGCSKIKSLLGVAQTEFALEANGLKKLDPLVPNPNQLITELLTFKSDFAEIAPAVLHGIATGVASRASIDLDKFKLLLLQVILLKFIDKK